MPTFEVSEAFLKAHRQMPDARRSAFRRVVRNFVEDLRGGEFRAGLRVKGVRGMPGCFEMTWAPDGRAIFTYGTEVQPGEAHIIWLAIGSHSILP